MIICIPYGYIKYQAEDQHEFITFVLNVYDMKSLYEQTLNIQKMFPLNAQKKLENKYLTI